MKIELRERLKQRDWLRQVVESAISKRDDLFRKPQSPTAGLSEAQNTFKKFADNNLVSTTLVQAASSDALPLWRAFLAHANAPATNAASRFLLQVPKAEERNMDTDELRRFGEELRGALLQNDPVTGQRRNAEQTTQLLTALLAKPEFAGNFCPEFATGESLGALRGWWTNSLLRDDKLAARYLIYSNAATGANAADTQTKVGEWIERLSQTVSNANALRAADDRVDVSNFQVRLAAQATNELRKNISPNIKSFPQLMALVVDQEEIPLSTARAQRRFRSDFDSVFKSWHDLLASDDPIITSLLKSENLRFATAAMRRKAVDQIPKLYFGKDIPEATPLTARFKQAVENPEVSYLFGDGPSNPRAIEAFSREFYSAFHDPKKLNEAIKAEREADYDYWWLTFYPKAIPQGAKKLAGESIIEVAFPETVVPEVQYHRWLQDSKLDGARGQPNSNKGQNARKGDTPSPNRTPEDMPGGQPTRIELRNAAALLRDTLTVLEASELKSRFQAVRPMMLHALDAFTEPRHTEDERFWNGIRALYEAVFPDEQEWVGFFEKFVVTSRGPDAREVTNKWGGETISISFDKLRRQKAQFDIILEQLKDEISPIAGKEANERKCQIQTLLEERRKAPQDYETQIRDRVHAFALNYRLRGKTDVRVLNELRDELKNLDFDAMHVLFSILAVTETKARLPEKLNLFAWAGAQGVMIFSKPQDQFPQSDPSHAHAVKYFNDAEPRRGDHVTTVSNIDVMCYKAMQAEGDLYSLMLNAYFSRYPDVPSKQSIREAYFDNGKERVRALLYNWLDHYGILYDHPFSASLIRRLGAESFLTPKSQRLLFAAISNELVAAEKSERANKPGWHELSLSDVQSHYRGLY